MDRTERQVEDPGPRARRRSPERRRCPAKSGIPSQTRLTKKPNGTRLARAAARVAAYRSASPATERGQAGRQDRRPAKPTILARGSRRCSQPADRAWRSVNTACSMFDGDAAQRLLEPADRLSPRRGATTLAVVRPADVGGAPSVAPIASPRPRIPRDARRPPHRPARMPRMPADLVPDAGMPERRAGVGEERQRHVVVGQRCAEDAGQILQALRNVPEGGLHVLRAPLPVGEARGDQSPAAPRPPEPRTRRRSASRRAAAAGRRAGTSTRPITASPAALLPTDGQSTCDQSVPNMRPGLPPPSTRPTTAASARPAPTAASTHLPERTLTGGAVRFGVRREDASQARQVLGVPALQVGHAEPGDQAPPRPMPRRGGKAASPARPRSGRTGCRARGRCPRRGPARCPSSTPTASAAAVMPT